jgi:uncharacterized membrane protein YgcG
LEFWIAVQLHKLRANPTKCEPVSDYKCRLEIKIGAGLNQPFNRASCLEEMQQREMVPLLKKNEFGGGLVAGVDALAEKLRVVKAEPLAAVATTPGNAGLTSDAKCICNALRQPTAFFLSLVFV